VYARDKKPDHDYDQRPHVHEYRNETSVDDRHRHRMEGVTGPVVQVGNSHIHYICGSTSFDDGHRHLYTDYTGPARYSRDNSHVHEYKGYVAHAGDPLHVHKYYDKTGPAIYNHYY
jgi:hypothetical protein